MDSPAEFIDIDAELEEWLVKQAIEDGIDLENPYGDELGMIVDWKNNPTEESFSKLYDAHQPLIFAAGRRYYQSTQLPKTAVASNMTQQYIKALETYDPNRGTAFSTHLYHRMGRTGRYLQRYSNVGRIPENRSFLIDLLERSEAGLTEKLGRPPSDPELADEVMISAKGLEDLRHRRVTPSMVSTLREELRKDYMAEGIVAPTAAFEDRDLRRKIVFLHGSLSPEQQLVLEHTFEGFGKEVIPDADDLGKKTGMSGQKVRSLRRQIQRKVEPYYKKTERL